MTPNLPAIKICGVRDPKIAALAANLGACAVGIVFAPGSPRQTGLAEAQEIAAAAKAAAPGIRVVGVFAEGTGCGMLASAPVDTIQLHGDFPAETVMFCKSLGCEVWRLHCGTEGEDAALDAADAAVVDGRRGGKSGGTGALADWTAVRRLKASGRKVVLAGGLSAENLEAAAATGADILDVNSSLETSPGVKSPALVAALFETASRL